MKQQSGGPDGSLQSSQQLLASNYLEESNILNLMPAAVYVCDIDGLILKYNEQAVKLWGRRPRQGDKSERFNGSYKLYHTDGTYLPHDQGPVAECLKDGLPKKDLEIIMERPDFSRIYVRVNVVPVYDETGKQAGAINCFYDITSQKQTEKELKSKTAELQDYVDNANVGLHWVDANGIIKWANKAELDMLGYTKEEYIGHHIAEFHVSRDKIEDILEKLGCNETLHQYESELLCKNGSIKTVHINSSVYREDGKFVHTRCFTIDVTEQKKLFQALANSEAKYRELVASLERKIEEKTQDLLGKTEELKKSEERYHKMVEEVEDYAIIMLNKDGIVMNWNKGAEKIKGYKEEEIVGKSFQEFYLPHDKEKGLPFQLLQLARDKGKAIHEGWRKRKDGSVFWGSIVLTALHDDEGRVIGFTKVTRDLTERKLAEDQMKEYLNQLEFQNKELEQFVYAASHDMKEPLRKIHLYNGFIADNPSNQLDTKSRDYLSRSVKAAERMKTLIEDLLMYSKSTFDTDNYENVDLNKIIGEIMLLHKEDIGWKKGQITVENLPSVRAVSFQIKQLLFNLINNSIKYKHPERDVVLKINCELVSGKNIPSANTEKDKQYYKISVIDNGIGFDPRYADKIFEIFQRLNNSAQAKGSGIGLAICKKIVQNHKGFIEATGKPNEGACFSIYMPKD